MTTTPEFAPFGFFTHYATVDADLLRTVESLGFDTAWLGGSPPADLPWIDPLLSATERIRIVTAIVNIWSAPAQQAAQSWQRIQQAHPGRFILGIGAGHPEIDSGVAYKPYSGLVEYLDVLDQAGVPQKGRALAALAEKSLKLAAQRSGWHTPTSRRLRIPVGRVNFWGQMRSSCRNRRWSSPRTRTRPAPWAARPWISTWA